MARCKNCKEKFEVLHFNQKYCLKEPCRKVWIETEKTKQWKVRKKELKQKSSNQKNDLQNEINKLARLIDRHFKLNCIDCESKVTGVGNGAHYHNVGGNENIRFNLHNIHLSRTYCNKYNSEHKKGYQSGLNKRYGAKYANYVETELNLTYKELHLTNQEVTEALKKTRKAIREFNQLIEGNPIEARNKFNSYIGIYLEEY